MDQAAFDQWRKAGTRKISGPLGEVTANAPCTSGSVDEACIDAARQQLKAAAVERKANLVVIIKTAVMQSYPPRYSATGELYVVSQ